MYPGQIQGVLDVLTYDYVGLAHSQTQAEIKMHNTTIRSKNINFNQDNYCAIYNLIKQLLTLHFPQTKGTS